LRVFSHPLNAYPPRYVNAHPSGPPYRYYIHADAEQAVATAREVIEYCERHIPSKPFHARIPDYLRGGMGIPMDVFPYTLVEAQRMLGEGTGVVPVALREGIWLLDRARVRKGLMEEQEAQVAASTQDKWAS